MKQHTYNAATSNRNQFPRVIGDASTCKFCGAAIVWDTLFGKPHSFNPKGSSHMDTCINYKKRTLSLRYQGDLDTYYKNRWRQMYYRASLEFNRDVLEKAKLKGKDAEWLAAILHWYGAPCRGWDLDCILESLYHAGVTDTGELKAVAVDFGIMNQLKFYFQDDHDHYLIGGLYIVKGEEK